MLDWQFKPGIEKDLESVVESLYNIMKKHQILYTKFKLYGFNAVEVEIMPIEDSYMVQLLNDDPYEPHYLTKDEYEIYQKEKEKEKEKGFVNHITYIMPNVVKEKIEQIVNSIVEVWKYPRDNEINYLYIVSSESEQIVIFYDKEKGFLCELNDEF